MAQLKRKYGDRSGWKRVVRKQYAQRYVESKEYKGDITLLKIEEIKEPLSVKYDEQQEICIANKGYMWLQHFPENERHSVTTMFNDHSEIVQWYIGICYEVGNEKHVPWMDDLFLDIVVLPSGDVMLLDEEELEQALITGTIDNQLYDIAQKEAEKIMHLIRNSQFTILELAKTHKEILTKTLE
ncbi:DUF402 domain-containing protein [Evansella halocellulosilytica]|uniref:DUF402 domain-containing protein n=1 Tax=Evansella halocellulosilytica TaxID=2011013 RepID=UPI000BB95626|nr:DUF402 domain-containing protein [Evansella halocellulosilytica]